MSAEMVDPMGLSCETLEEQVHGEIESALWAYLVDNCLPQGVRVKYGDEESLFDTGILDSAALISFVCFIEEEFTLTIPDEDLLPENFTSIASIAAYIKNSQATQTSVKEV